MQIRLKPYHKNLYPASGLLICGETIQEWITAISLLHIDLQQVESYAVPGVKANSLYGCVLFFNGTPLPKDIHNHQYLQYAENKLLIPYHSIYQPTIDEEELRILAPGKKILLHPVVGTVILDSPINWSALLEFENAAPTAARKPVTGVHIPGSVNAYMLELSDEKLINDLLNPASEKEIIEKLPFDVKKLMKGNKREMEKYLKYLEANPDKALDIALPLDVLGSFRGDNKGKFSFSGNWMQRLFNSGNGSSGTSGRYSGSSGSGNFWWIWIGVVSLVKVMTCNSGTHDKFDYPVHTIVHTVKKESVLDSHYNNVMASKRILLFTQLNSESSSGGNRAEKYRLAKEKLNESGKHIRDSLETIYTAMSKKKTDSVVKAWKKFAVDSIKKTANKTDLKKQLQDATKLKRENTYRDYAVYYGVIQDSAVSDIPVTTAQAMPAEKAKSNEKKNTGYILFLTIGLIGLALMLVRFNAPETARGKISVGQDEISIGKILVLLIVLVGSIVYILKPLLETYGFGWLSVTVCILLLILLYRLFGRGLTILNSNKEK